MAAHRILKTSAALLSGQGVNLLAQFLLPPLFLRSYGVATYGEWLTLSAAIGYLGTLNFGLQTFANNQAGIAYSGGETDEAKTIQGTALLILLGIIFTAVSVTGLVFFLPLSLWLKLELPNREAALIAYLLGLQVLARMLFGLYAGSFLVAGVSYRGTHWANGQTALSLAATIGAVALHSNLAWIACLQVIVIVLFTIATLIDLRLLAPDAVPHLRYAKLSRIRQILKPSGYFAMLFSSNFLVYQIPVLMMNQLLGPATVVVFSLTRTIYSMSRQLLTSVSQAMGPEILELYGRRQWRQLYRLYDLSERAVFTVTPVVCLGTFAATPFLITFWLHKPELYNVNTCAFMALISAVMAVKEHKYQFQTSANQHSEMARTIFFTYIVMAALSYPGTKKFGLSGFLITWLITEILQVLCILRLNRHLFSEVGTLSMTPVFRLSVLLVGASAASFVISALSTDWSDKFVILLNLATIVTSAFLAYWLFGARELRHGLYARLLGRTEPFG